MMAGSFTSVFARGVVVLMVLKALIEAGWLRRGNRNSCCGLIEAEKRISPGDCSAEINRRVGSRRHCRFP